MNAYKEYYRNNERLPAAPNRVYKNLGWKSWGEFLGTGVVAHYKKQYREFNIARDYARSLQLKTVSEWRKHCKLGNNPSDISSSPHNTYKDEGWISYGDWLGTNRIADGKQEWRSFKESRMFAHSLKLKARKEWVKFARSGQKPTDIPTNVYSVYKDDWKSWADFLGATSIQDRSNYLSFEEAREIVQKLNLNSRNEWLSLCKSGNKPKSVPSSADKKYANEGWKGWKDFLGKEYGRRTNKK
jgi:hypothetical protein